MEKTHWKKLINLNYIGAYSLNNKDLKVVITNVKKEVVIGDGGKKEECIIAYLKDQKPMVLNRTNCKTIAKIYGTPLIEDWIGKEITIYPTTTKVAGEIVECLRIRQVIPTDNKSKIEEECNLLRSCSTIEGLKTVYNSLKFKNDINIINTKDEMKLKLEKNV